MNEQWIRLCTLIDDDAPLLASMRTAVEDPTEFSAALESELHDRTLESAEHVDPWDVLIDGLDDAGALAYLDREDGGVELADALPALPRIFATGVDLDPVGDVDDLSEAIAAANLIIGEHGLTLVYLDEESDAYPLVAVATANVDEISTLATALGHKVSTQLD